MHLFSGKARFNINYSKHHNCNCRRAGKCFSGCYQRPRIIRCRALGGEFFPFSKPKGFELSELYRRGSAEGEK